MKRIGIMTGTRAEYGLLKPLMQEINKDNDCVRDASVTRVWNDL